MKTENLRLFPVSGHYETGSTKAVYAVPGGARVQAVFHTNRAGIGLPVAYELITPSSFFLKYTPYSQIVALCRE